MTHTPTFSGLDLAGITRAEVEIGGLIDRLSQVAARDTAFTSGVEAAWAGSDSAAFAQGWRNLDRPALDAVLLTLLEVRDELSRNRRAQDHTSRSLDGPAVSRPSAPVKNSPTDVCTIEDGYLGWPFDLPEQPTVFDSVVGGFADRVKDAVVPVVEFLADPDWPEVLPFLVPPPELIAAMQALQAGDGRRHLTDAQFDLLLRWRPERLLHLDDLSDAEKALVLQAVIDRYADRLPVVGVDTSVAVEIDTFFFEVGAELSGATVVHRDGSVEVVLGLSGDLGVEFGEQVVEASVGVEVGGELVYRFRSEAEADAFVAGLYAEIVDLNPFDAVDYLRDAGPEAAIVTGGVAVELEADVNSAEGELRVAAGGGYDVVNDESFVYLNGELDIEVDGVGSIGADVNLSAILGDDGLDRIEIEASLGGNVNALSDVLRLPHNVDGGLGGAVWVSGELDLTNPAAEAAWQDFVGGSGSFADVIEASDLVIGVDTTQSMSSEHDYWAIEVETDTTISETVATYIKPPFAYGSPVLPEPTVVASPVELVGRS